MVRPRRYGRISMVARTSSVRRPIRRWHQDNRNMFNQESKFDFLAIHQCLGKLTRQKTSTHQLTRGIQPLADK